MRRDRPPPQPSQWHPSAASAPGARAQLERMAGRARERWGSHLAVNVTPTRCLGAYDACMYGARHGMSRTAPCSALWRAVRRAMTGACLPSAAGVLREYYEYYGVRNAYLQLLEYYEYYEYYDVRMLTFSCGSTAGVL